MKKKVGLDFDDVLIDFSAGLLEFHNATYGTSYTIEDVTSFEYKELWKCDYTESLRRMREFVTSPYHEMTLPIKGAVDAVKFLQRKYDTPVITARDKTLLSETRKVANMYFPRFLKEIHFLHENDLNVLGTKGEVCSRLGVSLMVEDSLGNAETLSKSGIQTLLFDRPWNKSNMLPELVTRVYNWDHALDEIEMRLG